MDIDNSSLNNLPKEEVLSNSSSPNFFLKEPIKKNKETLSPRQIILALLKERNWKQTDLAREIGMSPQGVNNYLRGFWEFPVSVKIKIAQALKVDSCVVWGLK